MTTLLSYNGFTGLYHQYELKTFSNQLSTAIQLGQILSLTRNEDIIICAQKDNICQDNWQGDLILQSKTKLEKDLGPINPNLNIDYQAFYAKELLLIQHHGNLMNNGTFHITINNQEYQFILSKQGIITTS